MTDMKKTFASAVLAVSLLTSAPAFAEEATPAEPAAPAPAAAVGMPNPIIQYRTIPELELAIGFPVFYLPANLNPIYHPAVSIYGIHGLVADLRFESNRDNSKLLVRSALLERVRTEDISGHHGLTWNELDGGDMEHTKVKVASLGPNAYSAHWQAGRFVYSIDITEVDENTFRRFLKAFVTTGDRFAFKFRNFTLNTHNVEKIMQEAEAVSNPEAAAAQPAAAPKADEDNKVTEWRY